MSRGIRGMGKAYGVAIGLGLIVFAPIINFVFKFWWLIAIALVLGFVVLIVVAVFKDMGKKSNLSKPLALNEYLLPKVQEVDEVPKLNLTPPTAKGVGVGQDPRL